jgi:hypothetical protein
LNAPFKQDEYGDYEKYEKNTVEEKNDNGSDDFGYDTFFGNYNNMLRKLNTKDGDHIREADDETIAQKVSNYNVHDGDMMSDFISLREGLDLQDMNEKWEAEKKMMQNWDSAEAPLVGRLSPFAKELVYRNYLKGATVKDLSLKFGILAQRVKAIIY